MQQQDAEDSISKQPTSFRRDKILKLPAAYKSDSSLGGKNTLDAGFVLLQSVGVGIYGLDLNGFVTYVNPAARRMTGWTQDDLRCRTQHSMVHHSHADGRNYPREECPIYMAFHDGRTHCREDEVFWRKDGSSFPVEYTSTPVFADGNLAGAVVVFSDITNRVRKREWDLARIDILKAILRGRGLEDTINALCDAFTSYQRGCSLLIHTNGLRVSEGLLEQTPHESLMRSTVVNQEGIDVATVCVACSVSTVITDEKAEAFSEACSLFETACNQLLLACCPSSGASVFELLGTHGSESEANC